MFVAFALSLGLVPGLLLVSAVSFFVSGLTFERTALALRELEDRK